MGLYHSEHRQNIEDLKACPYSDIHATTRPHPLIVPVPMGQTFKPESMGTIPSQSTTHGMGYEA